MPLLDPIKLTPPGNLHTALDRRASSGVIKPGGDVAEAIVLHLPAHLVERDEVTQQLSLAIQFHC